MGCGKFMIFCLKSVTKKVVLNTSKYLQRGQHLSPNNRKKLITLLYLKIRVRNNVVKSWFQFLERNGLAVKGQYVH